MVMEMKKSEKAHAVTDEEMTDGEPGLFPFEARLFLRGAGSFPLRASRSQIQSPNAQQQ